jgi:hypothetical protein
MLLINQIRVCGLHDCDVSEMDSIVLSAALHYDAVCPCMLLLAVGVACEIGV